MATNEEVVSGIRKLIGSPSPRSSIVAYHGSPYDFDNFDSSKIGTGDGQARYGHGMNFSGNEGLAKHYRDTLAANSEAPVPEDLAEELSRAWRRYEEVQMKNGELIKANPNDAALRSELDNAISEWQGVRSKIASVTANPGRVYKVEIAHPESSLLNLDAMPNEQSEAVKRALEKFGFSTGADLPPRRRITGFAALRWLGDKTTPAEASRMFLGEGVPGAKYLDEGSRATGSKTSNYVMFPGTEDQIRILRKYGVAAPITAGAAAGQEE